MKKKIFASVAIFSLMATVALGVAVNSSDHLSLSLPGQYSIEFSTHYVGSERMRSVALLKSNDALAAAAETCPADQVSRPTANVVAAAAETCPADQVARPTTNAVAAAAETCPADQVGRASQTLNAMVETGWADTALRILSAGF